jgi:hypothetical protein
MTGDVHELHPPIVDTLEKVTPIRERPISWIDVAIIRAILNIRARHIGALSAMLTYRTPYQPVASDKWGRAKAHLPPGP